jgi:hypothetical protein
LTDKNGKEVYRIYITLNKQEDVDELMKHRSSLRLNGEPFRMVRTLPKYCPLYNRQVTGLKIKIHQTVNDNTHAEKINEFDLRKYFQQFGIIRKCEWTNKDQAEALFTFAEYE